MVKKRNFLLIKYLSIRIFQSKLLQYIGNIYNLTKSKRVIFLQMNLQYSSSNCESFLNKKINLIMYFLIWIGTVG